MIKSIDELLVMFRAIEKELDVQTEANHMSLGFLQNEIKDLAKKIKNPEAQQKSPDFCMDGCWGTSHKKSDWKKLLGKNSARWWYPPEWSWKEKTTFYDSPKSAPSQPEEVYSVILCLPGQESVTTAI